MRAVTWNLFCGGVDGSSEERLHAQAEILAGLEPDVLALQECTQWDEAEERRLLWMADTLGLTLVSMARSRIGDGRNHTALLYRSSKLRLVGRRRLGEGVFHHALIRARFRLFEADNDHGDFLALATHLSYTDGESRLREARWMTDYAGDFPGVPPRAVLLGDMNCPSPSDEPDWDKVPRNLQSRYRLVQDDGTFGDTDTRAMQVLLESGWQDPETITGTRRAATVGYYYRNEPVPLSLDHALVYGLQVYGYHTHDTAGARKVSDHLPVVLDVEAGSLS
ncbi:endonuclease/exonuclease/phosphatase family protein [Streptomyces sp. GbtcB6]|uniref:endonuclease/exonuclease/phosphatase family protein n=1 Tax=Streptomyces sp. GbtcB6 TaxID=2824751 RepID=UPI0020C724DF|nr:endonuclease/exonuclease/phosphatase family protein [Streptomyces sp. GbtcB6]